MAGDLDYPNLAICKIRLKGGVASARPPVVLPQAIRDAASQMNIDESPYDFSLERHVIKRQEEREQDRIVQKASSREELQSSTVTKMKNLTGADEAVCVAILEKHNYDVTTSIEAFFLENES
ncbi:UBA-like domain containing protein [Nitzschia inconspicua]|uniref:UBA-like domain containing protein n=1 Tax=Nitzschia inconspicua TaxID=303405 RepID=A0A9K3M3R5_9STRA|nr:UBA-like domain containing protein [Nitzschia inconspicua]